jgi:ABC-type glycerol-3-phosphate transport system substrate-binding protein
MMKMLKSIKIMLLFVTAVVVFVLVNALVPVKDYHEKYAGENISTDVADIQRADTYQQYLLKYSTIPLPCNDVAVPVTSFAEGTNAGVSVMEEYEGRNTVVIQSDGSTVSWNVDVPVQGFYNVEVAYIAISSRGVNMERTIKINGMLPFKGADSLTFSRLWTDADKISYDNQGNAVRPAQTEVFGWQTKLCSSNNGYVVEPYRFYFAEGRNTLSFIADNEPMGISGITLSAIHDAVSYKDYAASEPSGTGTAKNISIKIQGEDASVRSDPSLFARYDRSSPVTDPYSITHTVLNYIGGDMWKSSGQWIQWNIEIPSDGWYTVSIKARQSYQRGYISCRTVYIDGTVPFSALESVEFPYSTDWNMEKLADEKGVPCKFYLTKGTHTLRLEATLGNMGRLISEIEDSIYRLNIIYRKILVLTGPQPDMSRDYNIDQVFPHEVEAMNLESKRLYRMVDEYVAYTGQKSDKIAPVQTLAVQLEKFYKRPDRITIAFTAFKDNITSLGTALLNLSETKLDIDYILVNSADVPVKFHKADFAQKFLHETKSFFASFFIDYSSLGNVYSKHDKNVITVWLVTGRDQNTILKNMVDETFTPVSGVKVNVRLVNASAILSAIVAGKGPDIVLSVGQNTAVDYAMRNADVDLTQFSDFNETIKQFYPSAYESFKYNGGIYALPETETFNLLFYRKDILRQLGLSVPDTWDDLIAMFPTLQGNNLSAAIPYTSIQNPNLSFFYSLVLQNGGKVYTSSGTKTALDSEAGISAFRMYTNFFNNYGLPAEYDFLSRFRSGEMPVGVVDYTNYNTLTVSAPEIRGLWDFALLPGTLRTDAHGKQYTDRTTNTSGVCCIMIRPKDEAIKQNAWKFMKWWVSAPTQLRFGREMEALLGSSARYATANVEALKQLSWSSKQLGILIASLDESEGLPEVPGSYYTSRHVTNAVRKIINEKEDPRETMIDYARKINEELTKKRQEFGLPAEENQ